MTQQPGIHTTLDGGVATITMNMPSANAVNAAFLSEMRAAFERARDDAAVRAVVLASGHPKIFSPGLDLRETFAYDRPAMQAFFTDFTKLFREMFSLEKPMVAAVGGHAIAGGFCLTLCADFRLAAAGGLKAGLNEMRVGVILPHGIIQMLQAAVAPNVARDIAYFGNNYTVDEARGMGVFDEVVPPERLLPRAQELAASLAEKPAEAFAATKRYLRAEFAARMAAMKAEDVAAFLDVWFLDSTRTRLQSALDAIQK